MLCLFLALWLITSNFCTMRVGADYFLAQSREQKTAELQRDRAYSRQQFSKNFRDLQLLGQKMLKEHENKQLTPEKLAKGARAINKCAKTLKFLMVLGDMADPPEISKDIETAEEFDDYIRRLAKHIYDFAHNPIHQNSKVFNTNQAERAQTDLLSIIDLSKIIENKSKAYSSIQSSNQ